MFRGTSLTCFSAALATSLVAGNAAAANCSAHSGPTTGALVELFTSEGCDSCPPADRWLGSLREREATHGIVSLAFHVDYWDYLGWKDPYASAAHTQRQREAVWRNRLRSAYTPQVLLNGRDMSNWRNARTFGEALERARNLPARAKLALSWRLANGTAQLELSARLLEPARGGDAALYVAIYENGLVSHVKAGENRGATLQHDSVVREFIGPIALAQDGSLDFTRSVALSSDWKPRKLGVAVFIQERGTGEVLQALVVPGCEAQV